MRCAHGALYRGEELFGDLRARSDDLEDFRGRVVLLHPARAVRGGSGWPGRQRLRQGRAAAASDGVRGRGAEADLDLARRERGLKPWSINTGSSRKRSAMERRRALGKDGWRWPSMLSSSRFARSLSLFTGNRFP